MWVDLCRQIDGGKGGGPRVEEMENQTVVRRVQEEVVGLSW